MTYRDNNRRAQRAFNNVIKPALINANWFGRHARIHSCEEQRDVMQALFDRQAGIDFVVEAYSSPPHLYASRVRFRERGIFQDFTVRARLRNSQAETESAKLLRSFAEDRAMPTRIMVAWASGDGAEIEFVAEVNGRQFAEFYSENVSRLEYQQANGEGNWFKIVPFDELRKAGIEVREYVPVVRCRIDQKLPCDPFSCHCEVSICKRQETI